jgi:hypothetical protein
LSLHKIASAEEKLQVLKDYEIPKGDFIMPFKSEKQRRYLWKNEPKIAREWTKAYGSKPVRKEEKDKKEKKIMEDLVFIDKIRRIIKMRHDDVVAAMVSGGVDNMEKYQYMLGQLRTYQYMSQEISSLLEKKEQKKMTEQLSVSNQKEVPKHREALQEKYDQEPKKPEKDLTSEQLNYPNQRVGDF